MTTDLIKKLEALTGPDRGVDWLIAEYFEEIPEHKIINTGWDYGWFRRPNEMTLRKPIDCEGRNITTWSPELFTSSVDAAIALAERVLPGGGFFLRSDKEGHNFGMVYPDAFRVTPGCGSAASAAISMCIAILKAKDASHD